MSLNRWTLALALFFAPVLLPSSVSGATTILRSGSPFGIKVWDNNEDGLPQNSVITMIQTRDGYLWLGTLDGLARFDGDRGFTVFREQDVPAIGSSQIVGLFEDSQGGLWIGTQSAGIALARQGKIINLGIGRGGGEGRLVSACEDATGAVWLLTADGQLCRYRNGRIDRWQLGPTFSAYRQVIAEKAGLVWVEANGNLLAIATDEHLFSGGTSSQPKPVALPAKSFPIAKLDFLLASPRGGYWRLSGGRVQKWTTNHLDRDLGPYPWGATNKVAAACEDQKGNLVVGTLGAGAYWFNTNGTSTCLSTNEGLSNNYILSLLTDHEGSLWVGTDGGGLDRVRHNAFKTLEGTESLVVQSVCDAGDGGLWIGLINGGVCQWRDGKLQHMPMSASSILGVNITISVRSVFVDRARQVWAGTWGEPSVFNGLFRLANSHFQQVPGPGSLQQGVLAIHQDRRGQLWVGTRVGLIRWSDSSPEMFTMRDGLSANVVCAITDDREGNLWIGTEGGGLERLHDRRFEVFRKQDRGLPSDDVSSLLMDDDGALWIGTSRGLARLKAGKWTRYTTHEGLGSNAIGYLTEDSSGNLWLGSKLGLMRLPKKALNDFAEGLTNSVPCRAYGKADGLPTRECTQGSQPATGRSSDGTLWFPTIRGLVSVNPAELKPNTNPPPVMIEQVLVDFEDQITNVLRTGWPEVITIPAGKERLDISYTSLNLADPDRARFKYQLEGHENWVDDLSNARVARYANLSPRRYRFHVIACNEDGVWNPIGSSLIVIVEPPFWRKWWFLSAVAAGLLGIIVTSVHYISTQRLQRQVERLRQQEALEQERARIARDIHDQLGASLTQVSLLGEMIECDKHSPDDVESHARQISQTARETTRALDEIVWTVNPSNDTLDGLMTYVCKYAQEYLAVAGIRYRIDGPTELPRATISPEVRHNVFLAAKEAVTNVVRHAKATEVQIRLRLQATNFTLAIEDNGRGPSGIASAAAQSRSGMANMRSRMESVGGTFSVIAAEKGGTVIQLTAPMEQPL